MPVEIAMEIRITTPTGKKSIYYLVSISDHKGKQYLRRWAKLKEAIDRKNWETKPGPPEEEEETK